MYLGKSAFGLIYTFRYYVYLFMDWWTFYFLILLLGASQGLILGFILLFSAARKKASNRFLALLLFFFSYRLIAELLESSGISNINNWGYHALLEYNWIYGALLYFFVLSYIRSEFKLQRKDWWHFLPVGLEFLFSNWVKMQNFFWDGSRESLTWVGAQSYMLWMHTPFSFTVAALLVIFYVWKGQILIKEKQAIPSPANKQRIHWLQRILVVYFIFSCLALSVHLVDYFFFNYAFDPFYIFPTYVGMALITYWLALEAYARRKEAPLKTNIGTKEKMEEWTNLVPQLEQLMQKERLFLDPTLTLQTLAERLAVKPYQLSQILNRVLGKNFNDFINEYRVNEAIRLMNHSDFSHYSLMAIALESGFNSKATFNRIFKKIKGTSPSEFMRK